MAKENLIYKQAKPEAKSHKKNLQTASVRLPSKLPSGALRVFLTHRRRTRVVAPRSLIDGFNHAIVE
jgi:hypothetical protein